MISALILTVQHEHDMQAVIHECQGNPALACGEPSGRNLPLALESASTRAAGVTCDELMAHPGVASIDLVYVDHSEEVEQC